ncbi:MAG: DUF6261 family protein [Dysgonamonadaceae bacterium]|jgi:hypothetical protein|nr:DUF6261 family protein [Dysgonamonadaceae bacterium]
MKINTFYLYHARAETHYQFMLDVAELLKKHPKVADIVSPLLPELNELLDVEGQLVDAMVKSFYTEKIADADRRRDRAVVGFNTSVRANLRHFDPEKAEAAKILNIVIKSFRNEIEKKAYKEESSAITIFVGELRGEKYAPMVARLELTDWVEELAAAEDEFRQLFNRRQSEFTARPEGRLRDVRKQLDAVYHNIVKLIMAYTALYGEDDCTKFIRRLNYLIAYNKNKSHNHLHAKKNIGKANIRSIPNQVYAGEPVIVLPEVFYGGKKLVFTVDYVLSYQDNNRVGTALVVIHGKGAYEGKTFMRFNIVKPAV